MESKMFIYTDNYGDDNNVRIVFDMYRDNENLFVGFEEYDEELEDWDSYCDVTVNIVSLPFLESAINMNYGGQEKIAFLIKNGFGELAGYSLSSGFSTYPVFRFNADKIKELNPVFFEQYAKTHGIVEKMSPLKEQISSATEKAGGREKGAGKSMNVEER